MFKDRMWFLGDKSFKQVGKSSMKKKPGCLNQQQVASVTDAQSSTTFSPGASGILSWGGRWILLCPPGFHLCRLAFRKSKLLLHLPEGEMPNYHTSEFPLEGWCQGLNSAPPQVSIDTCSWKALAVTLPPPQTHTHPWEHRQTKAVSTNPGLPNTPPWDQDGESGRQ